MTACLLYAKIHKNKAENLLHLMLYFSPAREPVLFGCNPYAFVLLYQKKGTVLQAQVVKLLRHPMSGGVQFFVILRTVQMVTKDTQRRSPLWMF